MSSHVTLLEKKLAGGRSRVCDYRCYNGKPEAKCQCICGGRHHGIGLDAALAITPEELHEVRLSIPVDPRTEHVVLRMFA